MMSFEYPSPVSTPAPAPSPDDAPEIHIMEELLNAPPPPGSDDESPVPARREIRRTRGFNRVQRGDYRRPRRPASVPRDRAVVVCARRDNPSHALYIAHLVPGSIEEVRKKLTNLEKHRKQWRAFIRYWEKTEPDFSDLLFEFAWDCRTVKIPTPPSFVPVHPLEMSAAEFKSYERWCEQIWQEFQRINLRVSGPVPLPPHFRDYWFTFSRLRGLIQRIIAAGEEMTPKKRRLLKDFGAYRIVLRW